MRNRIILILAGALVLFGVTIPLGLSAAAAPTVQICAIAGSNHCVNRNHGATAFGTHAVSYYRDDANNDFSLATETLSYCGNTNWVHNGENGLVCPFANGSGLNARYDGKFIMMLHAYHEVNTCAGVTSYLYGTVALEACGSNGYLWVDSPGASGEYLVNVG